MTEQVAQLCIDQFYPAFRDIAFLSGGVGFLAGLISTYLFLVFREFCIKDSKE